MSSRRNRQYLRSAFALLFLLAGCLTATAQTLEWARNIGNAGNELARSITTDPDGNIYLGGHFTGTVDFDPGAGVTNGTAVGSNDLFIAKYSPAGALLWVDVMGGAFSEETYKLAYHNGNLYLSGYFIGFPDMDPGAGTFTLSGVGGQDAFFARYKASDGSLVWAKNISSGGNEIATAISADGRGNVYVGGEFNNTPDFDPGAGTFNLTTFGQSDGFVSKYDSLGNFLWAGQLGGTLFDYVTDLQADTAGAIFLTGSFSVTSDMDLLAGVSNIVSAGGQDIFFCKYTTNGNLRWAQRYGSTANEDFGQSIGLSGAMHLVLTGYFQGTVDFNGNAGVNNVSSRGGSIDAFIARYDTAGGHFWAFPIGDGADDRGHGVHVTDAGVVYATGYIFGTADFDPSATTVNVSADFRDPYVARYDAGGNFSWAFTIFGGSDDRGQSLSVDPLGKIICTGFFRLTSDFAPGAAVSNLTSNGTDDVYFAKYIPCQEPSATSHPQVATTCSGGNASLSFTFSGPADSTRWYRSTDEGATWQRLTDAGIHTGTSTTTLSITGATLADNSAWYRAVLYSCIRAADTTDAAPLYVIAPSAAFFPLPQDACEDAEAITFTPYQFGLQFDAGLDYLTATDASTGNVGTDPFTLEMWVNTTSATASHLLTKGVTGACGSSLSLGLNAAGKVTLTLEDAGCVNTVTLTSATSVNTGTWRHIAVTRSGLTHRVFVDGALDAAATSAVPISVSNADPIVVGSSTLSVGLMDAGTGYSGQMDEIRLWAIAKAASEISALRRLPMQGNEDYLRAAWPLNEGTGAGTAQDLTAGNSDLVLTGFTLSTDWVWTNTHLLTWAWDFGDASSSTLAIPTHTYTASNTYTASLVATTPAGCSGNFSQPVFIVNGPSASWWATSVDTCVGDDIVFTPDQYALRFDGVDELAGTMPHYAPLGAFTLEAWIRPEGPYGTDQMILYNGTSGTNGYGLLINAAGNLAVRSAGSADATTTFSPPVNAWTHVALSHDLATWRCHVNGVEHALSSNPAVSTPSGGFSVGGTSLPGEFFTGRVDEVRVWSAARTQPQIAAYMQRTLTGNETSLLAAYNMDLDKGSATVNNQVAASPDLTLANMEPAIDYLWSNPLGQSWQWKVNEVAVSTDSILTWAPPLSGTFEVNLTATNSRGCTLADSAIVVGDTVRPLSVCKNITLYLDAAGAASILVPDVDNGTTDACGLDTLWLSKYSFACSDTGVVPVRLVVRDNAQLLDSCVASVTVRDTLNPVQACQNLTVHLDAAGNASITPAMVDAGSTDNCGIATRTLSQTAFTCAHVGMNNVTLTLRDVSGNRDSCTSAITVVDSVKPSAVCKDITLHLNPLGSITLSGAALDNGSADACGIASLVSSVPAFTCAQVGANAVTLTVTDVNGNMRTCASTVTVVDSVKPVANCQDITRYLDAAGNLTVAATEVDNVSLDACGIATRVLSQTAFTCAHVGANPVTLTVTDVNGNLRACNATLTVLDTVKPNALCQPVILHLDSLGNASTTAAAADNSSTDACGISTRVLSQTSFTCAHLGSNPVTLTLTDVNGNVSSCATTVQVNDTIDIFAVCRNLTAYLDGAGNVSITPAQVDSASWDNCGIVLRSLSATSFSCAQVGPNAVTLTVEDPFGNIANCLSTVTVSDTVTPTVTCNSFTVFLDAFGTASITPGMVLATQADNCALLPATLSQTSFSCADAGMVVDTLFLSDVNGNATFCLASLNVVELVPPVANCRNVTVHLDSAGSVTVAGSLLDNASTDNCSITSIVPSPSTFGCGDLGPNLSQVVMADASANRDTCFSTITVVDTIALDARCRNVTVFLDAAGNASIDSSMVNDGSYDNCAILTMALSDASFTCADVGANPVTLTVTNQHSQTDACGATVNVQDTTRAAAACRSLTLQLDATGNATLTPAMVDNGSTDNCGIASRTLSQTAFSCAHVGPNAVTLTLADVNGNLSSCVGTITVADTVRPNALCKNVTLVLDSAGSATLTPAMVDNGSTDACGISSRVLSQTAFGCAHVGANPVTLTFADVNGNLRSCAAVLTVQDTLDVSVTCNDTVVYLSPSGSVTIDTGFVTTAWWDNCAVTGISLSQSTFTCADVEYLFLEYADQNQPSHNSLSAEDRYWQSFISTMTGELTRLRILDSSSTTLTLRVYAGAGTGGTLLHTQAFSSVGGWADVVIPPGVNVTTGGQYTFEVERITLASQPVYSSLNPYGSGIASLNGFTAGGTLDIAFQSSITVGTLFPEVPITITATDAHGNSGSCTATVTVLDTLLPTAACVPQTLYLDGSGSATASAALVGAGSADNCGIDSLWLSQRVFTCAHLGANSSTLFVRDSEGNVTTCVASITVLDTLDPLASCAPFTAYLDSAGAVAILPSQADAGSTDNCGITSSSVLPSAFNCADLGARPITLTHVDASGNSASCATTVTIADTVAPWVTACPVSFTLMADSSDCSPVVTWAAPAFADNCGISVTSTHSSGASFPLGATVVSFTAADSAGLEATCTFTVTVVAQPLSVDIAAEDYGFGYGVSCHGSTDGILEADASGGCLPYSYAWSNGMSADSIGGLAPGSYSVTVTDGRGLTAADTFVVLEPAALTLTVDTVLHETCPGLANGGIQLTTGGGMPLYTHLWSDAATGEDRTSLAAGSYTVTLTDAMGCMLADTFVVPGDSLIPHAAFSYDSTGTPTWVFTDLSTGGVGSWLWTFGDGDSSSVQHPTHTYDSLGYFDVTLVVTSPCGSDTVMQTVFVDTLTAQLPAAQLPSENLSPNPTAGAFTLTLRDWPMGQVRLTLMDMSGQVLMTDEVLLRNGRGHHEGSLSALPQGVYLLEVGNAERKVVLRVVRI